MGSESSPQGYWHRLALMPNIGDEAMARTLEMCSRVLPIRIADETFVEGFVDDPDHLSIQIQIIQTILSDQIARERLQASQQVKINAEVVSIVRQVSGVTR